MMQRIIMHDGALPTMQQLNSLQGFLEHTVPPAIKAYRSYVKNMYEQQSFANAEWKTTPFISVAWDTINLHDFHVPTVELGGGVVFCDIRDAVYRYPELVNQYLLSRANKSWHNRKIVALVEACFNRGAVLIVPAGVQMLKPLDLQSLLGGYRQDLLLEKIIVLVGAQASVTIQDTLQSTHCAAHSVLRSIEYVIGAAATLTINHNQHLAYDVYNLASVSFSCAEHSVLNCNYSVTGGATTKTWYDLYLQGTHATATIHGAFALKDNQHLAFDTLQMHEAEHTSSQLLLKGILNDSAQSAYKGKIHIQKSAVKSKASLNKHALLLNSHAQATAIPTLEVLNNDVQCAHGSAIGQLDMQQLFYLQSRGLDLHHAKRLLLEGFFAEVVTEEIAAQMMNKVSI
ncbi:MAG TPA: SufD family Fe-S cluster assembly protein [Candidatus Babeliales bacterium]|nr:SufD family Fe-S cluster assembly protein [Candidatus Babeliales bacterium]